jgi:antitoxin component of MazEF toxin-antitoxin module
MQFKSRKLQQVRNSFFVLLPPDWIKSNEMKKSDPVRIELLEDGNLKISPVPKSDQGSKGTGTPTATTVLRRSVGHEE